MTTARDIVNLALFDSGVVGTGQTASAQDSNYAFTRLQDMISQWSKNRWLIFHLIDVSFACTGAVSYTVGTGGNFNTRRPDRIEAAYIRQNTPAQPNSPDWQLRIIQAREDYSQIVLKQLGSFPQYLFYDSAYPLGSVFPWPLPSNLYTLHLVLKDQLQQLTNLSDTVNLPEEYFRAIRFNLIIELLMAYKLPISESAERLAAGALAVIRNANTQVPLLKMPSELVRPGLYNVFTDQNV